MSEDAVDLQAIGDGAAAAESGVAHAEALVAFAEALVHRDDAALARARDEVMEKIGPGGLVDTAAVASNFQRMVRIADSTGIPLDAPVNAMTGDIRGELELGRFGSSVNTREAGALPLALGRALRPVIVTATRWALAARDRLGPPPPSP
jgi:hypothetical protein